MTNLKVFGSRLILTLAVVTCAAAVILLLTACESVKVDVTYQPVTVCDSQNVEVRR